MTDLESIPDIPPKNTVRWSPRSKEKIIIAIEKALISREQAMIYYDISHEELASWMVNMRKFGKRGLRVTQPKKFIFSNKILIAKS